MEPNNLEPSSLPKDNIPTSKSRLPLLLLILVAVLGAVFFYTRKNNSVSEQLPTASSTPQSSTAQDFSPEVKVAIEKFVTMNIDALSPTPPKTSTFTVHSFEHRAAGETIIIYSDKSATYTARGVFEVPAPKQINIVAFDIIADSSNLLSEEKQKVVEASIKENISELSPEKEVLGGKFMVTSIAFGEKGNARVSYEDGHNAYIANVRFTFEENDQVKILDWMIVSPK